MKRFKTKFTSLLLAIVMCLTLGVPALAANDVSDSTDYLHELLTSDGSMSLKSVKNGFISSVYVYEGKAPSGAAEKVTETVYRNGEISLHFEEGTLTNYVQLIPSGEIYLDGNLVTATRRSIDGNTGDVVTPHVGYQHISSQTSLWANATYSNYKYTEHCDIELGNRITSITLRAFIVIVSHAYPPLGFAAGVVGTVNLGVDAYYNAMKIWQPNSWYAYIEKDVYTTPTMVNPPNQYFKYYSRYYQEKNSDGTYSKLVDSDITYGALMQGL